TIVIALGGGHHISAAIDLAHRIIRRDSRALVRIVTGVAGSRRSGSSRIRMLPLLPHLGGELARCTVAVVGGGVTAYEACCLATPAVAVAVAPAQRRAIRAFAARGALIDGGSLGPNFSRAAATVASQVDTLMSAPGRRRAVGRAAARIVDGRGALRVARALRRLAAAGIPS
ncbi:MAG TPA: hypothetical protein VEA16_01840, partial [Vicinamibacterales bacterium]|nr:hypothetical protein [Vicinamibacterales bacterium]